MYFCRKPFFIVKAQLSEANGWDASALGMIGTAYLIAYAVGQFVSGAVGNRQGPRVILLGGMAISIACNLAFGFTNSLATFIGLMVLNGLAQSTGWSGTVGTMASWFRRTERGTVMGVWATCYQVGGIGANTLAAYMLGKYGYRYSFLAGAAVLMVVLAVNVLWQRDRPEDVGLKLPEDEPDPAAPVHPSGSIWTRSVVTSLLLVGSFYFFVKFIRYAIWSWVPFFLSKNYGMAGDDAGYLSTIFDVAGLAGVLFAGWASDRFFKGRRAGISFLLVLMMGASCLLMFFGGPVALGLFGLSIGLVGFSLYGPDALMSGAGAQDIGSEKGAVLAAGVINGMGAVGAVLQETVIARMYDGGGGELGPIFAVLVAAAVGAGLFLGIVLIRNRLGVSDV